MSQLEFHQYLCHSDNYGVLVHCAETDETFAVDVPDADKTLAALRQMGWKLTHVLVTHHHDDHIAGIPKMKAETGCTVIGPKGVATVDRVVAEGDVIELAGEKIEVIATPGHTLDMLNYHLPQAGVVFVGDTLFAMGCGRVFEGTAEQMWESLQKLMMLPQETVIYCGHEYTLANGTFAQGVDPHNPELASRMQKVKALRTEGKPTVPTVLSLELRTNPFLRADDAAIRRTLGMENASDAEVFAELRERKNRG